MIYINHGKHSRDFTYIDDLVEIILKVVDSKSHGTPANADGAAAHRVYNIGSNNPIELRTFLKVLEETLDRSARINYMDLQPGDVEDTFASVEKLINDFDYKPSTSIQTGIKKFVDWYLEYYDVPDPNHNAR